jgi:hypothetical protein
MVHMRFGILRHLEYLQIRMMQLSPIALSNGAAAIGPFLTMFTNAASLTPLVHGSMGLCAILDKSQAISGTQIINCTKFSCLAKEVHNHYRTARGTEATFDADGIQAGSSWIDVGKHRRGTTALNRRGGGVCREGSVDHLITSTDTNAPQSDIDCIQTIGNSHGFTGGALPRPGQFESLHLLT